MSEKPTQELLDRVEELLNLPSSRAKAGYRTVYGRLDRIVMRLEQGQRDKERKAVNDE